MCIRAPPLPTRLSRKRQAESIRMLKGVPFTWLLPGHGRRCRFEQEAGAERDAMFEEAAQALERYDPTEGDEDY
jgi:glyoxylase-like metal-dependent hydrolase (beta-lactamase superfamily II)